MRHLSHWGWGFTEALPDATERKNLAMLLSAVGFPAPTPVPYPSLDAIDLPAPGAIPDELAAFATDDREERARHTYGRAFPDLVRGLAGDFGAAPAFVAYPRDEADVLQVLDVAAREGLAVTPFGGGTSVCGGVERAGAISLDLTRMDRVLEVIPESLHARIQGGARGPRLEAQLAEHDLTLRHYPQSFELSTLGGWLATRAGGHFATRYTHIDDLAASIRMVTPTGVWDSRRLPGSGAGPSPDRLALGSEGILGVITEAWMRVFPRPRWRSKASVHFADFGAAVEAVRAIAQARLYPSNCRLLDSTQALLDQVAMGEHVLLLGFESAHHPVASRLDEVLAIATAHGGRVAYGPKHLEDGDRGARDGSAGKWRESFFRGPYKQTALVSMGMVADTFETAIPWDRFDTLHRALHEAVTAVMPEPGLLACRFTHVYPDGPAPYYTFVCPPGDDLMGTWRRIKETASDVLIAHGATITHHHAVGRTHRPWYAQQRPDPFARALLAAKRELDPAGVLNPGVLLAETE